MARQFLCRDLERMPGHDHSRYPAFLRGIGDPNAVPIGQHDIGQHEVIGARFELRACFSQRGNQMNPIAGGDEDMFQDRPDIRVVLYQKDELCGLSLASSHAPAQNLLN